MYRTILLVFVISIASWALIMALFSMLARKPTTLGVHEGKLATCPATPNCVCSQEADSSHAVDPIRFDGDPAEAWQRLLQILQGWPRTQVITSNERYLHAECTSRIFRFVDDLECLLDEQTKCIHVRSASRTGRSDLGVNRRRVEALRHAMQTSPESPRK